MLEKLALVEERYEELNHLMADPEVATDPARLTEYAQEQAEIEPLVQTYRQYKSIREELAQTESMLNDDGLDADMRDLVVEEIEKLKTQRSGLESKLQTMLLPKDPKDEKNVIVEIRAGAGGDEAGLFGANLYRMYTRYAESQNWDTELLSAHETGIGGFKEVIFMVKGKGAYSRLKYESGVHRVQRVPVTEASGRIHTSTATVAVLPEVDEIEVEVDPADLRVDVYCSSGPGGQHMQKNATAVRITHLPTGMVVACESERSQLQNRVRAMAVLRSRLYAIEEERQQAERGEARRLQVGTGGRSEKIRTYNFPQNRVTDHRVGLTVHRLTGVLDGDLDEIIEALSAAEQVELLQAIGEG
ncbi:MAG: peptide chain release factor 1 [Chloroflexota bacterium]|nr:peptide chain release factor 1 [Chloroflexota bacterium]